MSELQFLTFSDLTEDSYCVFGLATCFKKQDGEIETLKIVEPVPSAALEAIVKGVPTSYEWLRALKLGEVFSGDSPRLPANSPEDARLSDDFTERTAAAARTYKVHPRLQDLIPLGTVKTDLNYSTEKKRVLNGSKKVSTEDNIKQHSHTHKTL